MSRRPLLLSALVLACGPIVPVLGDGDDGDSSSAGGDDGSPPPPDDATDPTEPVDPSVASDDGGDAEADDGSVDDGFDTGVPSTCGDGQLDDDEQCDDGNDAPGDGCEADCTTTPGVLLWEQTVDGGGDDAARAVMAVPSGEIYVAGSLESNSDDMWLRVLDATGVSFEDRTVDLGDDEIATSLAKSPDNDVYVAGVQQGEDRAVLLRLDGSDLAALEGTPEGLATSTVLASSTGEGIVLVTHGGDFDSLVATVRRYDSTGNVLGDLPQPPGVFVGAAITGAAGGTLLAGGTFGGPGTSSTASLSGLAMDGSTVWSTSMEADPGTSLRVRGLALAPDGRIVGVGTLGPSGGGGGPGNDDDSGWIWWWTADGVLESDGPLDIGGAQARPSCVVVGTHGLIVGGATVVTEDGFVAGLSLEGEPQWGHQVTGDLGLEDRVSALALVPSGAGGVVAVGRVAQSGSGEDAWIGMFTE